MVRTRPALLALFLLAFGLQPQARETSTEPQRWVLNQLMSVPFDDQVLVTAGSNIGRVVKALINEGENRKAIDICERGFDIIRNRTSQKNNAKIGGLPTTQIYDFIGPCLRASTNKPYLRNLYGAMYNVPKHRHGLGRYEKIWEEIIYLFAKQGDFKTAIILFDKTEDRNVIFARTHKNVIIEAQKAKQYEIAEQIAHSIIAWRKSKTWKSSYSKNDVDIEISEISFLIGNDKVATELFILTDDAESRIRLILSNIFSSINLKDPEAAQYWTRELVQISTVKEEVRLFGGQEEEKLLDIFGEMSYDKFGEIIREIPIVIRSRILLKFFLKKMATQNQFASKSETDLNDGVVFEIANELAENKQVSPRHAIVLTALQAARIARELEVNTLAVRNYLLAFGNMMISDVEEIGSRSIISLFYEGLNQGRYDEAFGLIRDINFLPAYKKGAYASVALAAAEHGQSEIARMAIRAYGAIAEAPKLFGYSVLGRTSEMVEFHAHQEIWCARLYLGEDFSGEDMEDFQTFFSEPSRNDVPDMIASTELLVRTMGKVGEVESGLKMSLWAKDMISRIDGKNGDGEFALRALLDALVDSGRNTAAMLLLHHIESDFFTDHFLARIITNFVRDGDYQQSDQIVKVYDPARRVRIYSDVYVGLH